MAKAIEVYHQNWKWHVRRQGEASTLSSHEKKEAAVSAGRAVAKREGAELIVKNLDGRISEKDSHGPDPRSVPG